MVVVISRTAAQKIRKYYLNVHKKFRHDWGVDEIHRLIDRTIAKMYQIENGLPRRTPTISRWKGYYMTTTKDRKWNFAYRIVDNVVYVEDACHSQNMHESTTSIRLTEAQFKRMLTECITKIINEIA